MRLARLDRVREALPLLDEGMALATSGRLSRLATGMIYCRTIWACIDLLDYRRAAEWMEAVERCALETGFAGYSGDCHAHRATALVARGCWGEAECEAQRAREQCERFDLSHIGLASYAIGEVHLRRGDLSRAAEAFGRANEYGIVPQPGVALLEAARGDVPAGLASLEAALEAAPTRLTRARFLPAAVDIALAMGDTSSARRAAVELAELADAYGSSVLRAAAAQAAGAVALVEGDARFAVRELRRAVEGYRVSEVPYELGRARFVLGEALLAQNDRVGAVMEFHAARTLFERLGAQPDVRAAERRLELRTSART